MNGLITLANKRPIGTTMIFLAFILLGILAINDLSVEFLPEIEIPTLVVSTVYPSASPQDVRNLVTIPLENALSSVKGLREIRSVSRNSYSTIEILLDWGVNRLQAELQVREIIDSQYSLLPEQTFKPQVIPSNTGQEELLIVGFVPQSISLSRMKQIINAELRTEIQQIPGVGQTAFVGGRDEEILAAFDPVLLTNRGLTPQTLANQFRQTHNRYPAGSFIEGSREFLLIGDAELKNLSTMRELMIYPGGNITPFKLDEIANITIEEKEQRSLFYFNGQEGIGLLIWKQPGSNPITLSRNIKNRLTQLQSNYGNIFSYQILSDSSENTSVKVMSIVQSLLVGILIAFLVLLIVTRKIFISVLTVITLPISLMITFLGMHIVGLSINSMSLGGIAIAIGMLVDNGVIVIENIDAKLPLGYSISEATIQVASANLGSTITSILVFLPLIFLPGIIGAVYRELAITVALSLLSSYFVAIFLLPVLYSLRFKKRFIKHIESPNKKSLIANGYGTYLKFFIRNKKIPIILIVVILFATVTLGRLISFQLADSEEGDTILIEITLEPGTRMVEQRNVAHTIYQVLSSYPWIKNIYFRAGGEPEDTSYFANPKSSSHMLHGKIQLTSNAISHRKIIVQEIYSQLFHLVDNVSVIIPPDSISRLFGLTDSRKSWLFTSSQYQNLQSIIDHLKTLVDIFPSGVNTNLSITPVRDMLDRSGITPNTIHDFFQSQIQGTTTGQMEIDGERLDIRFRAKNGNTLSLNELQNLRIPISEQTSVRTGDVVQLNENPQPAALYRENRRDAILVYSEDDSFLNNLPEINDPTFEIQPLEESLIQNNSRDIALLLIIALIFLYLFLGAQFESFSAPFVLLLTVPLSLFGVFLGLLISGKTLNLNSGMGVLVLLGLVVNSAILLRERSTQLKNDYHGKTYSIINAAKERFRPIIITVSTTVFSLFPIALEIFGPTQQSGLAWVIIGGLSVSTLLSLFIIPWVSIGTGK